MHMGLFLAFRFWSIGLCVFFFFFKQVLCCLNYYSYSLQSRNDTSDFVLSHDCFGSLRFFVVPGKVQNIFFPISVKNVFQILIGILLNLQMALGTMDILTILNVLIHEHGISFHMFVSYSMHFFKVLQFSLSRFFTCLINCFPSSLLYFVAVLNGISFKISFSNVSLLMYRNAIHFCILILYPGSSLNLLSSSNNFLVENLGFFSI